MVSPTPAPARPVHPKEAEYDCLTFDVDDGCLDLVSLALLECGSLGCEEREASAGRTRILAYFPTGAPAGAVGERLLAWLSAYDASSVERVHLAPRDWNALWRSTYRPIAAGPHLTVLPSWSRHRVRHGVVVRIRPDFAFGTGSHETTRLCLELLAQLPLTGRRVADVGTGSGILAIAAVRLGAQKVYACDPDPLALTNARHNIRLNRVGDAVKLAAGELSGLAPSAFDLILANLVLEPLRAGVGALVRACRPEAIVIVSGLLESQEQDFLPLAQRQGLVLEKRRCDNDWLGLQFRLASAADFAS